MKKIFKGKKVLVMGLGLNGGGVGVAKFFCKQGAEVLVTDLKTEEKLKESLQKLKDCKKIKYALGGHREADFINADLIIKNPDVPPTSPYLEIAKRHNIAVETDVSLFFKLSNSFIIGITGTKGKSTTSSLIYHILKSKFKRTFLAGNIGVSPLELLPNVKKGDKVVLELSSFELEDTKQSPNIAVITNILPDHLNRYGTMEEYINTKKIIFKYQTSKDVLVLNAEDPTTKEFVKEAASRVVLFSRPLAKPKNFQLFGEHNLYNLAAATEVAKVLEIQQKDIDKVLKAFKGVSNRQEFVRELNGVKYFNDTTATMPDAVIAAIKTFSQEFSNGRLILICGGQNKGLEYEELAEEIKKNVDAIVMLPGTASERIEKLLGIEKINGVSSMQEAVAMAQKLAKPGDVVVLSPAAASFNLFKNEFDRGNQFVEAVKKLK
jgi:UDP-N-acetylmuramoylalanine--D-glutamate ligase